MKKIDYNDLKMCENFKHLIVYKKIVNTLPNVNVLKGFFLQIPC